MENISLVLSGGGSRCLFQLGVIKYLEESNINISAISGSSGGAIIGSLIASGKTSIQVLEMIKEINFKKLVKFNYFKNGFFHLRDANVFFDDLLEIKNLEELPIKMFITAVDLASGEIIYFDKGRISPLVMASSSLHPVFTPFKYQDRFYIDGGFMNNLPIEPIKKLNLSQKILAINVNPLFESKRKKWSFSSTMKRSLYLMFNANIQVRVKETDIYLEPKEIARFSIFDTKCFDICFNMGYKFAKDNLGL